VAFNSDFPFHSVDFHITKVLRDSAVGETFFSCGLSLLLFETLPVISSPFFHSQSVDRLVPDRVKPSTPPSPFFSNSSFTLYDPGEPESFFFLVWLQPKLSLVLAFLGTFGGASFGGGWDVVLFFGTDGIGSWKRTRSVCFLCSVCSSVVNLARISFSIVSLRKTDFFI